MRRLILAVFRAVIAPFALLVLAIVALAVRRGTHHRRSRGERPRLVYGPTPIISIKYMSGALRRRGYQTTTFVYGFPSISERSDYDASFSELLGGSQGRVLTNLRVLIGPYLALARLMRTGDIFHFFFDGGFLRATPLRFWELQLLHLAGKKVVVMPYGGDVAVPSRIRSSAFRDALAVDYPELGPREPRTMRWLAYFSRHADFVVGCLVHVETLPRFDLLTTHYYPIDTELWDAEQRPVREEGDVIVFHAPNHRAMKGTEFVIRACRELREEGLPVRLSLAEGLPNREVRRLLAESDILAEQFVLGYALNAMEGMSLRKPVLSNLTDATYYDVLRAHTGLDECPIVSTSATGLKDALRMLVTDPHLRTKLGAAGRRYVLKYHSYDAVGRMWELVYGCVWAGQPLGISTWHPGRDARELDSSPGRTNVWAGMTQ